MVEDDGGYDGGGDGDGNGNGWRGRNGVGLEMNGFMS